MFKDIDIKWVGAAVGLILTIGGGFTWFGVTNNKLDALSNVKTTVTENSKRTEINQKEIDDTRKRLVEIRERIISGEISFSDAAKEASDEKETRNDGGLLINPETQDYKFELTKMDPELYSQIANLKEKEVSIVYQDEDRFNPIKFKILSVSDRYDEHVADFSKDYLKIQKLALQNKQLKEIEKWQNDKIFDTYININNDFGDCDFFSNWLKK